MKAGNSTKGSTKFAVPATAQEDSFTITVLKLAHDAVATDWNKVHISLSAI
jgi:hypothetical protein